MVLVLRTTLAGPVGDVQSSGFWVGCVLSSEHSGDTGVAVLADDSNKRRGFWNLPAQARSHWLLATGNPDRGGGLIW